MLGDLLLACLMFWISIMRAKSSEYGGDRDSDLRAGSEGCATHMNFHSDIINLSTCNQKALSLQVSAP